MPGASWPLLVAQVNVTGMSTTLHPLQPLGRIFAHLPGPLAGVPLARVAARIRRRHPRALARIPFEEPRRLLVEAEDVGARLIVVARKGDLRLTAAPPGTDIAADARVAGTLSTLLGIVTGAGDGDALFFSRELMVEGDTALVVALRNAFDDAHLDLAELCGLSEPVRRGLVGLVRRARRDLGRVLRVVAGLEEIFAPEGERPDGEELR